MNKEIWLNDDDIQKVNFLRNEANLHLNSIVANEAWIDGLTVRRENFEAVREDLSAEVVESQIIQINQEISERKLQIAQSQQLLAEYTSTIAQYIDGKGEPTDVIDGAASDISQFNMYLGQ